MSQLSDFIRVEHEPALAAKDKVIADWHRRYNASIARGDERRTRIAQLERTLLTARREMADEDGLCPGCGKHVDEGACGRECDVFGVDGPGLEHLDTAEESATVEVKPREHTMKTTIGRIVHYKLTAEDALQVNRRRTNVDGVNEQILSNRWPEGAQAHLGNPAEEGNVVAGFITAVWSETMVNLQCILDGTDVLWVTSTDQGSELNQDDGTWIWPPRHS